MLGKQNGFAAVPGPPSGAAAATRASRTALLADEVWARDALGPLVQAGAVPTATRRSLLGFRDMIERLREDAAEYFEVVRESPYMLVVDQLKKERCIAQKVDPNTNLKDWVNQPRSDVPAITHVDYSARIQTVDVERNPRLHSILTEFKKLTGYGILVNTSYNVRSEPIVCTPEDAYRCFMRTGIDVLVLDDFLVYKDKQPKWEETSNWREEFGLD